MGVFVKDFMQWKEGFAGKSLEVRPIGSTPFGRWGNTYTFNNGHDGTRRVFRHGILLGEFQPSSWAFRPKTPMLAGMIATISDAYWRWVEQNEPGAAIPEAAHAATKS